MRGRRRGIATGIGNSDHAVQQRQRASADMAARRTVLMHVYHQLRAMAGHGQKIPRRERLQASMYVFDARGLCTTGTMTVLRCCCKNNSSDCTHATYFSIYMIRPATGVMEMTGLQHKLARHTLYAHALLSATLKGTGLGHQPALDSASAPHATAQCSRSDPLPVLPLLGDGCPPSWPTPPSRLRRQQRAAAEPVPVDPQKPQGRVASGHALPCWSCPAEVPSRSPRTLVGHLPMRERCQWLCGSLLSG